ncbi:hypothetical protein GPECTOR_27g694 [Gonium pectorale]|uniref:phytol kinase n=1 Tax=Gonium pectorale TaxID=33097 RepID=A0A150GFG5_GONPE|nr:hypothetical protein GPECTOR_27g694 [Gonium pectorale]|eukprot:KXZ48523.1 hypothetical protein GPECTOR_27g694 [Gonium pectorale]
MTEMLGDEPFGEADSGALVMPPGAHAGAPAAPAPATALLTESAAARLTATVLYFLFNFFMAASMLACTHLPPDEMSRLCNELADGLWESAILEHAACAMLLPLAPAQHNKPPPRRAQAAGAPDMATQHGFGSALHSLCMMAEGQASRSAFTAIYPLLEGRCLQHAAAASAIAMLRHGSGGAVAGPAPRAPQGPGYGLPPALLASLDAAVDHAFGTGRRRGDRRLMGADMDAMLVNLHGVLLLFRNVARAGALKLSRRGVLQIAVHAGWFALDRLSRVSELGAAGLSAMPAFLAEMEGQPGAASDYPPIPDATANASKATLAALSTAQALVYGWPAGAVDGGALAGVWRLTVAVALSSTQHPCDTEMLRLCTFAPRTGPSDSLDPRALPDEPSADVAAALEAGLLPALEQLLRAAGRDPASPALAVVHSAFRRDPGALWGWLMQLLAYGDERQAAALLVTLGKVCRRFDPWVILSQSNKAIKCLISILDTVAWALLDESMVYGSSEPDQSGFQPGEASQQLLRLLSLAACTLLPPLSALLTAAAARVRTAEEAGSVWEHMFTVFRFLPNLVARCAPFWAGAGSAGAAEAPDEAESGLQERADSPRGPSVCATDDEGPVSTEAAASNDPDGIVSSSSAGAVLDTPASADDSADAPAYDGATGRRADDEEERCWRGLLLDEMGAVELLGAALELATHEDPEFREASSSYVDLLAGNCHTVAAVWAAEVTQAAAASPQSPLHRLLPWRPEALREMSGHLDELGYAKLADCMDALSTKLEHARSGVWRDCQLEVIVPEDAFGGLLPGPAAARSLLHVCANPVCANLEGNSEAALRLQACGGCGAAHYCRRACQQEHWRAGHREACAGGRGRQAAGTAGSAGAE